MNLEILVAGRPTRAKANDVAKDWGLGSHTRPKGGPAKARAATALPSRSTDKKERAQATPETLAKLRPCLLKAMLHQGAIDPSHPAGMQPDQYEAALQIWDAQDALVKGLKAGVVDVNKTANAHGGVTDGKARLIAIYLQWAGELPRGSISRRRLSLAGSTMTHRTSV